MESASSQPTIKFGPYVVDLRAGELRKFGAKVRLQEKPLQLLAAIAEQSGQVVTRDELRRRLSRRYVRRFRNRTEYCGQQAPRRAIGQRRQTPIH